MISFYDVKNGYTWIGDAVDHDVSRFNTQQGAGSFAAIQTKVIEVGEGSAKGLGKAFGAPQQQDERPFSQSGAPLTDLSRPGPNNMPKSSIHSSYTSSLKILSL